jgi:predicted metal-dependent hydrolase
MADWRSGVQLSLLFDAGTSKATVKAPPPSPNPDPAEQVHTPRDGLGELPYRLRRTKRRTVGLTITDQGLEVSAARWVNRRQIEAVIDDKIGWIRRKLEEVRQRREQLQLQATRWEEGGQLPYLGRTLILQLGAEQTCLESVDSPGVARLCLALPHGSDAERIREMCAAWLQAQAKRVFARYLDTFGESHGVRPTRWSLSNARGRWGSCTADGHVRLNWRLIHFDEAVIRYVIAHELAHLHALNHGPSFWNEVERLMPDYASPKRSLRAQDPRALPIP